MPGRDGIGPMKDFVARNALQDVPQIPDTSGDLWRSFGVQFQPAWVIVHPDGTGELMLGSIDESLFARYAGAGVEG